MKRANLYLGAAFLALVLGGCDSGPGPAPAGPYADLNGEARVSELEGTSAAEVCEMGWSWLTAETGSDYSHVYGVHLPPRLLPPTPRPGRVIATAPPPVGVAS